MTSERLAECQRIIGYHFTDAHLLEIALTHSSVRTPDRECNERLEFLGDSVLGLAITDELYKRLPDQQEGELTRIKSAVVSRGALYRVSTRLGLVRFIEVAKGVGRREELPVSLTANLVESIIGAIYLDAGFFPAREFILRHLGPELEDVFNDRVAKNYKSLLQHEAQERLGVTPVYRTVEAEGPDHRRNFTVAAVLRGTEYGRASGINKKEAEQEAARHALEALQRSGRGRRRRGDARGEAPVDARSTGDAAARPGSRADAPRARDDDAWKRWAEAPPASAPAPASAAPYAIGPEADDGWDEHGAARSSPREPAPIEQVAEPPASLTPLQSASAQGAGAVPPEADASEPRGRRRRRGRGRAPSLDDGVVVPAESPAPPRAPPDAPRPPDSPGDSESLAAVFSDASEGTQASPSAPLPSDGAPAAEAVKPDARRPRAPARPRGRAPADAESPPRSRGAAKPPRRTGEAPASEPASQGAFEFGQGVADRPLPAAAPIERAVHDAGSVEAVKPAPPARPPRPPGGFGEGL